MNVSKLVAAGAVAAITLTGSMYGAAADRDGSEPQKIKHVLLLSIDGMHAVDFYNCAHGMEGVNSGYPYCPNMAALKKTGINYVAASASKPSDSFPGLIALVTGGTPKSTGAYYDVAYDRKLDAPAKTTGTGLSAGPCTPGAEATGTTTDFDQGLDLDDTKLNGGAPGAGLTEGTAASIDPLKLLRDPKAGCAPVWPWNFVRTNTIFGVAHKAGRYTAWIDKHPSVAYVNGPGDGRNVDDFYGPEVDSNAVGLPGVTTPEGVSCDSVRDSASSSWNGSFENIQCYDTLKVKALREQIKGKTHNGAPAMVPAIFGMNFQAMYTGASVNEPGVGAGGYQNAEGLPSAMLLSEIKFVDASIGKLIDELKDHGIYDDTLIIITAKHGGSPIDPTRYVANGANTPATLLGTMIPYSESPLNPTGIGATEDDVSVLWLKKGVDVNTAVALLQENATAIGMGQIWYGPALALNYNVGGTGPGQDPRSPDIIVSPNVGVTYSGSTTMIADHGGFAHDDTNVMMLVANRSFSEQTVSAETMTAQVAPTILKALGLDPRELDAVRKEGTEVLPDVSRQLSK